MTHSFKELVDLLGEQGKIWVRLYDNFKVCVVDIDNYKKQVFIGQFFPCTKTAKSYTIRYDQIKQIIKEVSNEG